MSRIKLDGYEMELLGFAKEISYYLQKSGASAENARDISQDVLVKMLESEIVLPFEKIRAWMYRVAVRLYIDRYQRDKKYWEILQCEFFKDENVIAFDTPDYKTFYQAVALLKEKYRLVIDLYYFQNLSKKAIESGAVGFQYSIEDETLSLEDDAKTYLKNNSNYKTATFSGVILTGRAENFVQLEDKDWIYASNIGQSVTIQPYHILTK